MDWLVLSEILLGVLLAALLLVIASGVGRLQCARRLGLGCGWMAFMPFLSAYLNGRMAEAGDRLRYPDRASGPRWGRHNLTVKILCVPFGSMFLFVLLALAVVAGLTLAEKLKHLSLSGPVGLTALLTGFVTNTIAFLKGESNNAVMAEFRIEIIVGLVIVALTAALFTLSLVFRYLLMYKTYAALAPEKAGWLLVLSFFLLPAALGDLWFLVLTCSAL